MNLYFEIYLPDCYAGEINILKMLLIFSRRRHAAAEGPCIFAGKQRTAGQRLDRQLRQRMRC
jgi:hypothetical protein